MPISKNTLFSSANICVLISSLMVIFTIAGHPVFETLSLYPSKVQAGQGWRILTANFVHFGWPHTLMNAVALLLCGYAFFESYALPRFLCLLIVCCLSVGLGIYFFNPNYSPYAGLSGTVHGLVAAGLIVAKHYSARLRCGLGVLLIGKLTFEQSGFLEAFGLQNLLAQDLIGVPVAVEAHSYGALGGATFALFMRAQELIRLLNTDKRHP